MKKFGLSNNQLKILALLTMTVDHIGAYLFPRVMLLRIVGRIAYPIFAYMIGEGCRYTRNPKKYLLTILANAAAHGYRSFFADVIVPSLGAANFRAYEYDGWYAYIGSLEGYFASSMDMLTQEAREGLFGIKNRPVLTKVRNSAPTKYKEGADVKNSFIADGCVIEGTVENSILFRGVKVGKGTVVKNSILMQDTYTGSDVTLNCVITDKDVIIRDGRHLSGHETMPFFVGKGGSV